VVAFDAEVEVFKNMVGSTYPPLKGISQLKKINFSNRRSFYSDSTSIPG